MPKRRLCTGANSSRDTGFEFIRRPDRGFSVRRTRNGLVLRPEEFPNDPEEFPNEGIGAAPKPQKRSIASWPAIRSESGEASSEDPVWHLLPGNRSVASIPRRLPEPFCLPLASLPGPLGAGVRCLDRNSTIETQPIPGWSLAKSELLQKKRPPALLTCPRGLVRFSLD
jgi:hypothetical protein